MRHKHADLIHAWAEGAEIEIYRSGDGQWFTHDHPSFSVNCEYRIKPTPKLDSIAYIRIAKNGVACSWQRAVPLDESAGDLKLTFDGETGELKSAEVLA